MEEEGEKEEIELGTTNWYSFHFPALCQRLLIFIQETESQKQQPILAASEPQQGETPRGSLEGQKAAQVVVIPDRGVREDLLREGTLGQRSKLPLPTSTT